MAQVHRWSSMAVLEGAQDDATRVPGSEPQQRRASSVVAKPCVTEHGSDGATKSGEFTANLRGPEACSAEPAATVASKLGTSVDCVPAISPGWRV